jgi:ribose transport system permease protein
MTQVRVKPRDKEPSGTSGRRSLGTVFGSRLVIVSPFFSAWLGVAAILCIGVVAIPESVSGTAFSGVLPLTAFLAIASIGQMLVIMTGGIDLSVPGVITMSGTALLGLSQGSDGRLMPAVAGTLLLAGLVGFINGVLVSAGRLNALIVTLSTGGVVTGLTTAYRAGLAQESGVPATLSSWSTRSLFGVSAVFWLALTAAIVVALVMRYSLVGRRFQVVGGNPRAARVAGIAVLRYQVAAYTVAGVLYGLAGLLLSGFVRTPNLDLGGPYLLGPIAAVVIAGTSLSGGTGSVLSTFAAAFFLTQISQTLRIVGLSSAWQYVIFGIAIAAGMLVSGDRIMSLIGSRLSQQGSMTWHDSSAKTVVTDAR